MTGERHAAVIVAAGAGARLGGVAKALLRTADASYLGAITTVLREVGVHDVVVVVGAPHGERVEIEARALGLTIVTNPAPARGMATSVACGFEALAAVEARAAWLWPVDHPDVVVATLRAVARGLGDHAVCVPSYRGRGGHPPLIARAVWPALARCGAAPDGARSVLSAADRVFVEVGDPGVARDIDTPDDLAQRVAP